MIELVTGQPVSVAMPGKAARGAEGLLGPPAGNHAELVDDGACQVQPVALGDAGEAHLGRAPGNLIEDVAGRVFDAGEGRDRARAGPGSRQSRKRVLRLGDERLAGEDGAKRGRAARGLA